jgi:DNA-binding beta-propeller fold protein YncE
MSVLARRPFQWIVPLAMAALLIAVFGVVSLGGSPAPGPSHPLGVQVAASPTASPLDPTLSVGVIATVGVQSGPVDGAYDPSNGLVYIANEQDNNVSVLSGTSVVATVNVSGGSTDCSLCAEPDFVAYNGANGYVYVVDRLSGEGAGGAVTVLSGTTAVGTVEVGIDPTFAVVDNSSGEVYVTNALSNSVTVIQDALPGTSVAVGQTPVSAAWDPLNGQVFVANDGSQDVSVLSGTSVVGALPAGSGPDSIAFDPSGSYIDVANNLSNNLTIYGNPSDPSGDLHVVANLTVGLDPSFVGYNPASDAIDVVNTNSSNVSVVQLTSVVVTLSVPSGPVWAGGFGQYTIVVDNGADEVTIANNTTVLGNLTVGSLPTYGISDPGTLFYVTNFGSYNVSVLGTPSPKAPLIYTLTFAETGLTSCTMGDSGRGGPQSEDGHGSGGGGGSCCMSSSSTLPSWGVTVNGVTKTTTGTSISFNETNGTYPFTVESPAGYTVATDPATQVTIDGANATVSVTFSRQVAAVSLSITFEESGLPAGTTWCVTLSSTVCSTGRSIVFSNLSAGRYGFSVPSVSGYTARPAAGSVELSTRNAVVSIEFSPIQHQHGHGCMGGGMG